MRRAAILGLLWLSACAPAGAEIAVPPEGTPMIAVASGSGLFGGVSVRVYPDDTVVTLRGEAGEDAGTAEVQQGAPGTWDRAVAALTELGPAAMAAAAASRRGDCPDYGADRVVATPPVGGFAAVQAWCPIDPVVALVTAIQGAAAP